MKNLSHWPAGLPQHLELPPTSLYYNLEVAALRYPNRTAIAYYGSTLNYAELLQQTEALAGFLTQKLGVAKGDRVILYLQNSPQFVIAFYAILRVGAVVVPVNTMNLLEEVRHIVIDSGSRVAVFAQELAERITPLLGKELQSALSVCYSDYLTVPTDFPLPEVVTQKRKRIPKALDWKDAIQADIPAIDVPIAPEDLAVIPYTSGTTGASKGCMHTHRSVMHTAVGSLEFRGIPQGQIVLTALPLFHVTGLQLSLNSVIFGGGTLVVMTRWDRRCAALLIEHYRVASWTAIASLLIDFLAQPNLEQFELSSLKLLTGGVAIPKAVAEQIRTLWGLSYIECYGLAETMATTHSNPVQRPKAQCLGIPIQDTLSIIVDPDTLRPLPTGEIGEILLKGPQVFQGYWNNPQATALAFVQVNGERFFRTGALGYEDEEGYFFLVDHPAPARVLPCETTQTPTSRSLRHPAVYFPKPTQG